MIFHLLGADARGERDGSLLTLAIDTREHEGLLGTERQAADVVRIGSLGAVGVSTMVAACLDANAVPAALVDFLEHNSDGNPLLVEELLAGLIAALAGPIVSVFGVDGKTADYAVLYLRIAAVGVPSAFLAIGTCSQ